MADAIAAVGVTALHYVKNQTGNPTEAAKKQECWERFQRTKIVLNPAWEKTLGEHAFVAPRSDVEALDQEWERILPKFLKDTRTIMGMAVRLGGKEYPNGSGGWIASHVAALDWEKLKMKPGFGPKKLRQIVELFSVAAGRRSVQGRTGDYGASCGCRVRSHALTSA